MTDEPNECCGTCRFACDWDGGLELCRCLPPVLEPNNAATEEAVYPLVYDTAWCGKWKAKPDPKKKPGPSFDVDHMHRLLNDGHSKVETAKLLGVDRSQIYRQLRKRKKAGVPPQKGA